MGYVRFHAWRLYSEPGLAQRPVAVWLYREQLVVAYNDTHLAQYTVAYEPDQKHLYTVSNPQLYEMQYCSPQLPLWQFGNTEWLKVLRLPRVSTHRKTPQISVIQERLFVSHGR